MKIKLFLIIATIFSGTVGFSNTVLKGTFEQELNDSISLYGVKHYPEIDFLAKKQLCIADFRFEFELKKPREIEFHWKDGQVLLFVEPGDQIELTVTKENAIKISGKGSENNKFLLTVNKLNPPEDDLHKREATMDGTESLLYTDRSENIQIAGQYQKQNLLSQDLKIHFSGSVNFGYWNGILKHSFHVAGFDSTLNAKQIPSSFFSNMNPAMMQAVTKDMVNSSYRDFITNWSIYKTLEQRKFSKFENVDQLVQQVCEYAKLNGGKDQSNYIVTRILTDYKGRYNAQSAQVAFNLIENEATKTMLRPVLGELLTKKVKLPKKKKEKKPEAPSGATNLIPDIKLLDMDSNEVSLRSFKGKVVYLDFWASWCGPCRGQMPHSKKLKEKFTKKELKKIAFVYVSIDTKIPTWKNAVEKYNVGGHHLISPAGWKSKICQELRITGIPRYMILDKNGAILKSSAKRPSDPTLADELKGLL